jgi:hypothetical protein
MELINGKVINGSETETKLLAVNETVNISETKVLSALITIRLDEYLDVAENVARDFSAQLEINESVLLSENEIKRKNIIDDTSINGNDGLVGYSAINGPQLPNTIVPVSLSDSIEIAESASELDSEKVNESITVTEQISKSVRLGVNESVDISENCVPSQAIKKAISETIDISEARQVALGINLSDLLDISETKSSLIDKKLSESIDISESL